MQHNILSSVELHAKEQLNYSRKASKVLVYFLCFSLFLKFIPMNVLAVGRCRTSQLLRQSKGPYISRSVERPSYTVRASIRARLVSYCSAATRTE